jgi:hypothetical protein
MVMPPAFRASSNPSLRWTPLKALGAPSTMATLSPGWSVWRDDRPPAGAVPVVRAHERDADLAAGEDVVVELVVDVHHHDAGLLGFLADGHERLRVGRGDDDGIDSLGDHLLDEIDLASDIELILDAVGHKLVRVGVGLLMRARAILHGDEEFVGERLHDQRDARFALGIGLRRPMGCSRARTGKRRRPGHQGSAAGKLGRSWGFSLSDIRDRSARTRIRQGMARAGSV